MEADCPRRQSQRGKQGKVANTLDALVESNLRMSREFWSLTYKKSALANKGTEDVSTPMQKIEAKAAELLRHCDYSNVACCCGSVLGLDWLTHVRERLHGRTRQLEFSITQRVARFRLLPDMYE